MKRDWAHALISGVFGAAICVVPAMAQTAAPSKPPGTQTCVNGPTELRPRPDGPPQLQGQPGRNLSEALGQSNGVICPPAGIDPEIQAPTPDTGDRSVIVPRGGPGADPKVEPK
jgi:hypothetical protein